MSEVLAAAADPQEREAEGSLRPRNLVEFIGQPELKEHLGIVLQAASERGEPAGHLLVSGPPGSARRASPT